MKRKLASKLVDDEACDQLHDKSGDAAADQLTRHRRQINAACTVAPEQSSQDPSAASRQRTANATDRAGQYVADCSEVGRLHGFTAAGAADRPTDCLND